ncbi:ribosomal protein s15 [Diplodia corticola]|uniref:Ribosomal protein s15 n=1 Tax=Diplodia corticola TaxID=236234 RepID=A0A1J9R2I9_9PEZI|nr:ribosomal protein s15 [Diplodia corticola]OJD34840.1 ribosomal protein s15 [Diplodia corticola]
MPPRISLPVRLRAQTAPSSAASSLRAFSTTPVNYALTKEQRRRQHDPYARAQAQAKKAANLSRQTVLQEKRKQELGDPVRGVTTPFVQSFDTGLPEPSKTTDADLSKETADPKQTPPGPKATTESYLNHYLKPKEVKEQMQTSRILTAPSMYAEDLTASAQQQGLSDVKSKAEVQEQNENAAKAIERIVSLSNANSKDRTRVNVQRCIDTFGRHHTDKVMEPRATAASGAKEIPWSLKEGWSGPAPMNPEAYTRGGPDTGSSEVQVAILTAKIRTLADFLETRGKNDKVNKRNLRLLVHRRQKLLKYLRKKERGGPRWQHLIETLGLTEGTWKGEISL